jgi:hypothetical protein
MDNLPMPVRYDEIDVPSIDRDELITVRLDILMFDDRCHTEDNIALESKYSASGQISIKI